MTERVVYQYDLAGRYLGETVADESPLEPGVFLMPARTVETAPPAEWPENTWPRWNGVAWELTGTTSPQSADMEDPVAKLAFFLKANPDVAALLK